MNTEWQYISSKNNSLVVRMAKLKEKKYRKSEGLFRFDGIKLFNEAAQNGAPIRYVFVSESANEKFKNVVEESCVEAFLYILSDDVFSKMSDEKSPEGIISVAKRLDSLHAFGGVEELLLPDDKERVFMLESIREELKK